MSMDNSHEESPDSMVQKDITIENLSDTKDSQSADFVEVFTNIPNTEGISIEESRYIEENDFVDATLWDIQNWLKKYF